VKTKKEKEGHEPSGKHRCFDQTSHPERGCEHTQNLQTNSASHDPERRDTGIQGRRSMANFGKSIRRMGPRGKKYPAQFVVYRVMPNISQTAIFEFDKDKTEQNRNVGRGTQRRKQSMKISTLKRIMPALLVSSVLALTASPALAKQQDKSKGKSSEKTTSKENSGRQAGELPSGLQKYTEKKGQLPSGLQQMKDDDGHLTKGLEKGGKKIQSSTKTVKPSK
jgi:hypothetical protein